MQMKYILLILLMFLLTGCDSPADPPVKVEKEEIRALAQAGNELFSLENISVENGSIEIELHLKFHPRSFEEVMFHTDHLAEAVAALFDYNIPVGVSAIQTITQSNEKMIFGESIFIPETGRVEYKHFGRDHTLQYGDP